jgi:ribose transport system ATP-binding protein
LRVEDSAAGLSAAQCQLIVLARALVNEPQVLILDEPTARLGMEETEQLFKLFDILKKKKVTIIYISHRLEEIYRVCDRVTILRDGSKVKTAAITEITEEELVAQMLGRTVEQLVPKKKITLGNILLNVKNLTWGTKVKDISFSIKAGELVGLVGAVGAGKSEVLRLIFGVLPNEKGVIQIGPNKNQIDTPIGAIKHGVAFVPEDRKNEGLVMDFMIKENISLVDLKALSRHGLIQKKIENQEATQLVKNLHISALNALAKVKTLSGGNQQKVVLSKWLLKSRMVFLLDEVTAGIDVGTKFEIYELLGKLAEEGSALLLSTSDIQEAMGLCDRLLIMHRGALVAELAPKATTREEVLMYMMGGNRA